MADRTFGLKMMLFAVIAILLIGRLVLHLTITLIFPLLILLVLLIGALVLGARLGLRR
jgi:hypothetical protein